jgi:hypothetical protein
MARTAASVSYGLLNRLSDQLLCSGCLRRGIRRRIVQVISGRHRLRSLCPDCRMRVSAAISIPESRH